MSISPTVLSVLKTNRLVMYPALPNGGYFVYQPHGRTSYGKMATIAYHCREAALYRWTRFDEPDPYLGFYSSAAPSIDVEALDRFWTAIHETLGIKTPVIIHRTAMRRDDRTEMPALSAQTVILKVPAYWRQTGLRRAIFTLLLRGAVIYGYDLKRAFNEYALLVSVRGAVNRFFAGHTRTTGLRFKAWAFCKTFERKGAVFLDRHLVRPSGN